LRATWQFIDTYCDEAYAVLSQDWINNVTKLSPSDFNLAALQTDLGDIDQAQLKQAKA